MTKITVVKGDITTQRVDVIINAANKTLLGDGGVDGAIHQAAGPKLRKECQTLGCCRTGEAKITKGYNLPAKFVIHTVGPIYGNEKGKEAKLLASCYKNCLSIAKKHHLKTIAFPAISTGVYGYPKKDAGEIATFTVKRFIKNNPYFKEIRFVLFSDENLKIYQEIFKEYTQSTRWSS